MSDIQKIEYADAIDALSTHRDKRPVMDLQRAGGGTVYIAAVVDWRVEMEAIVDGILDRAGY